MSWELDEEPTSAFVEKPLICVSERGLAVLHRILRKFEPNAVGIDTKKTGIMYYFNKEFGRRSSELMFKVFVPYSKRDEYAQKIENAFDVYIKSRTKEGLQS